MKRIGGLVVLWGLAVAMFAGCAVGFEGITDGGIGIPGFVPPEDAGMDSGSAEDAGTEDSGAGEDAGGEDAAAEDAGSDAAGEDAAAEDAGEEDSGSGEPECGNGEVEEGETCDGDCPLPGNCAEGECYIGSIGNCDAECIPFDPEVCAS